MLKRLKILGLDLLVSLKMTHILKRLLMQFALKGNLKMIVRLTLHCIHEVKDIRPISN